MEGNIVHCTEHYLKVSILLLQVRISPRQCKYMMPSPIDISIAGVIRIVRLNTILPVICLKISLDTCV